MPLSDGRNFTIVITTHLDTYNAEANSSLNEESTSLGSSPARAESVKDCSSPSHASESQ